MSACHRNRDRDLLRAYSLMALLHGRDDGVTYAEIEAALGVCRRTVYRHLLAAAHAGLIEFEWIPTDWATAANQLRVRLRDDRMRRAV